MTKLTLETAQEMETVDLLTAMKEGFSLAADGVHQACVAIAILEERGVELPMLPEVYRYAREIAEGTLSAHAGMILGRFQFAIKHVMKLPVEMQDRIADGEKIKIATLNDQGRVVSREVTVFQMSQQQMALAFSEGGLTPWEEQGEWLIKSNAAKREAEAKEKAAINIRVDSERGDIVVGRSHVSVDDLKPALAALGYQVKPLYGSKAIKPAKVA